MFSRLLYVFDWFFGAEGEAWIEKTWRRRIAAALLILAAFWLRIVWFREQTILARDEIFYLQLVKMPVLEFPPTHLHPPLLIWLFRCMYMSGLTIVQCQILLGIVSGTAFLAGCYFAARELSGRYTTALTALALAAVIPAQVRYTFVILRETLSIPLYLWFCFFCISWLKRGYSPKWMIAASCCGVLAVFCRYEAVELLLLLGVFALILLLLYRKASAERKALAIGFGGSAAAALLLTSLLVQCPGGRGYMQRFALLVWHYVQIAL